MMIRSMFNYRLVMSIHGRIGWPLSLSLNKNQEFGFYPWTKVALWELWHPAPYAKELRSRLTHHTSGNRHTDLSLSVETAVAMYQLQRLSDTVSESLESTLNHPWTEEPLRKSRFQAKKFQHTVGAEKYEFGCTG